MGVGACRSVMVSPLPVPAPLRQIVRSMLGRPSRLLLPLSLLCAPFQAVAQGASPYVPMDHWAMPFIEHLISAGAIKDPTPDTRPFKQSEIVHALEAADTTTMGATARATIRRLLAEWTPTLTKPHYRIEPAVGGQAANYSYRDPLELDRGIPEHTLLDRGFFDVGADVELNFGSIIAVTHPVIDTRLDLDPDWYGTENQATRFQEGYLSAQGHLGELFFGILDRNWGPSGIQGVLLSDNAYSLDHFYLDVGSGSVRLQSWIAQLNTDTATSSTTPCETCAPSELTGLPVSRYMFQDRLWIHPPGRWTVTLEEAGVTDGVGRTIDFWYLNPATISYFRDSNGAKEKNFLDVDFERRARATLFGQFMLSDVQVSRNAPGDLKPAMYALTVGAKGALKSTSATWMLFYTQVSNLAYSDQDNFSVPLYFNLPTGREFSDYDQATARLSLLLAPTFLLEPEIDVIRQGQGSPLLPNPLTPQDPETATILQGIVERIVHLGTGLSWTVGGVTATGNAGVSLLQNAENVLGVSQTSLLGSMTITYHFHHSAPLP